MKRPSPGRARPKRSPGAHRSEPRETSPRARRPHDAGTILILGGSGRAGVLLAKGLLRETSAGVVIAGRDLDKAEAVASRLREPFPERSVTARAVDACDHPSFDAAIALTEVLVECSITIADGVKDVRKPAEVHKVARRVKELEEKADAIEIIKWKDLYEHLEIATDKCEDVANIIETVLVKNA